MKAFLKFFIYLIFIAVILVLGIYLTAGWWLPKMVSTFVPKITKVPVSLQEAELSLLKGQVALKNLKIGNPEGFSTPTSFELDEISVRFEPKTIFQPKMIINEIKITGTKVAAEINKLGQMNLIQLNQNVQEYFGSERLPSSNTKVTPQRATNTTDSKKVVVQDLQINNSSLTFGLMGYDTQVKLPNIQQKNIGEKQSKTIEQICTDIFEALTKTSLEQISKSGQDAINTVLNSLSSQSKESGGSVVKNLKNQFKNLF